MRRAARVLVVTVALASAATSCSGGAKRGSTPVAQWVETLCTSVTTWTNSINDATTRFGAQIDAAATNAASTRASLVGILDDSLQATDTLVAQLDLNGAPAVDNGTAIQSKVVGAFRDGRKVFVDARSRAESLPPDSARLVRQANAIASSIDDGFNAVGKAFGAVEKLDGNHKIADAGNREPTCRQISMDG
jgi:hypothetical protein